MFMIVHVHYQPQRRCTMFWIFILITALGFMLVKLGALSVMVKALLALLCLALLIIAGLVIVLLWRKMFKANGSSSAIDWRR